MATCPECDAEIDVHDDDVEEMEAGDPWDCDACGSRLRVASVDPLEFETDDEDEDDEEEAAEGGAGEEGEADDDAEGDEDEDDADDGGGGDWEE